MSPPTPSTTSLPPNTAGSSESSPLNLRPEWIYLMGENFQKYDAQERHAYIQVCIPLRTKTFPVHERRCPLYTQPDIGWLPVLYGMQLHFHRAEMGEQVRGRESYVRVLLLKT